MKTVFRKMYKQFLLLLLIKVPAMLGALPAPLVIGEETQPVQMAQAPIVPVAIQTQTQVAPATPVPIAPTPMMPVQTTTPGPLIIGEETKPVQMAQARIAPVTLQAQTPVAPAAPVQIVPALVTPEETEKKDIYLNFENTALISFIDYIAELKKLNIIPDKTLEGSKISLTIREPLSVDGAWNIFLTVLEMAGFSIVKVGDVHKIIPKDKKLTQPLPAFINVPYTALPDSDLTIRYVTFLTNLQVSDVEGLVGSMLSTPNALLAQKDMNAFIMADKSYNIKAAVKLLQELDQMGLPENVTVLRLKRVNATDTKQLLDSLIKKPEGNPLARLLGKVTEGSKEYFSPTTRVIAEERTNSLILLGNTEAIDRIVSFITTHIDTQIKEAESPLHIYELQNIDAGQVRDILKTVTAPGDSTTGQVASKYGAIRGGVKYFKPMNFDVDKAGNRLIVYCQDKQDWKLLSRTLDDLDKPQPQVAIESFVVLVDVTDTKEIGGTVRNKKHGQLGKNIDAQSAALPPAVGPSFETNAAGNPISLLGNLINQFVATQGQTVLTFGSESNVWALLRTIKTVTNSSVLSQPFVTVANKTMATIEVGTTVRIEQDTTAPGAGNIVGFTTDKASTKLDVTPQINLDGIINLKIAVNINEFINDANTEKTERILNTAATVADGQVLVLGGFVQTKVTESIVKTPILSDIPVFGWFFKDKQRIITKQYIFIFMSPTIVKPRQLPGMQLYTKMKLHQATDDIENAVETKRTMDPVHNWFFNSEKENYSHKVIDFANARYQPTTVDIKSDPYYRSNIGLDEEKGIEIEDEPAKEEQPQPRPDQVGPKHPITIADRHEPVTQLALAPQETMEPAQLALTQPTPEQAEPLNALVSDEILVQRRKKLRELLAKPGYTKTQDKLLVGAHGEEQTMSASRTIDDQKREAFKELVSEVSQTSDPLVVDQEKRNSLKDFLTQNPSVALKHNRHSDRRNRA